MFLDSHSFDFFKKNCSLLHSCNTQLMARGMAIYKYVPSDVVGKVVVDFRLRISGLFIHKQKTVLMQNGGPRPRIFDAMLAYILGS